jgi:AcrR family transcriptional regulator
VGGFEYRLLVASRPLKRAPRRSSEEVRAELLRVAAEEFASRSYRDVTAADITDAAGVSTSVMYRHFASKSDLFREATLSPLAEALENFAARWRAQRHAPDHWTPRRIGEEFMSDLYHSVCEHRDGLVALASAADDLDEETAAEIEARLNNVLDQVLLVAIAEKDAGRLWFPRENLDLGIRVIVAMVFGATTFDRWLIPGTIRKQAPGRVVDVLTDVATRGLSGNGSDAAG